HLRRGSGSSDRVIRWSSDRVSRVLLPGTILRVHLDIHWVSGMREWLRRAIAMAAGMSMLAPGGALSFAQQPEQGGGSQGGFVIRANAELVLTNVVARDAKTGELVRGLKQDDFTVYENGKKQQIATFDYQSVEMATPLHEAMVSGLAAGATGANKAVLVAKPEELRNHRLIVFFFDLTSMQPEDLDRSVDAAREFLKTKM